jgi:hypothetical protein
MFHISPLPFRERVRPALLVLSEIEGVRVYKEV